jgi:hypothetical protein
MARMKVFVAEIEDAGGEAFTALAAALQTFGGGAVHTPPAALPAAPAVALPALPAPGANGIAPRRRGRPPKALLAGPTAASALPSQPPVPKAAGRKAHVPPPAPRPAPAPTPISERAPTRRHPAPAPPPTLANPVGGTVNDRILECLRKRAMSSRELINATGIASGQVYTACSGLKGKGYLENREDPADGEHRWHITHLAQHASGTARSNG